MKNSTTLTSVELSCVSFILSFILRLIDLQNTFFILAIYNTCTYDIKGSPQGLPVSQQGYLLASYEQKASESWVPYLLGEVFQLFHFYSAAGGRASPAPVQRVAALRFVQICSTVGKQLLEETSCLLAV